VLATDLDVTLLQPLTMQHPNLQVRPEDVVERVPTSAHGQPFDFAHARLVLGHVTRPERALENVIRALRPGGWVLIEDADFLWTEIGEQPLYPTSHMQPYFSVWREVVTNMSERGYAVHWGRRLASAMRDAGLERVAGEAVMSVGDPALQRAMRMTIERFGGPLVEAGRMRKSELAACLSALDDPALLFTSSPTFSVWGRRPAF
jgi:SAM-dependent methyltransferase